VPYATARFPHSLVTADFNQDGHLDLATAGAGVSVLQGTGMGTFQNMLEYDPFGSELVVGNFNNDLFPDLAAVEPHSEVKPTVAILLNTGRGR
jgi:hypothetical protein